MTEKLIGTFEDVGEELIGVLSAPDVIYEANYNLLFNRPKINGVELEGDKSWNDLGLDLTPYATVEWVEDNYYTKTQTTEQIANEIDTYDDIVKSYLLEYYTKVEADGKFALAEDIPTDFYTKSETDEKIEDVDRMAVQALNTGSYANQRIDALGDTYETKISAEGFKRSISAEVEELRTNMPTNLSQLTADTTHRTVTDEQIAEWNAKSEFDGDYNSLANKPTIPSKVAELSDASEYAKKSEIPTDYATQSDIDTALNEPMSDVATVEGVGYDVAVVGNSAKLGMVGGRTVKQAKMKSVDLGTLTWYYRGNVTHWTGTFSTSDLRDYAFKSDVNAFCDNYEFKGVDGVKGASDRGDKTCALFYSSDSSQANDRFLYVRDDNYHDAASFKSAMSGVMLTYESTEDELVSAKVDKINAYPIPSEIQQLDGYGLSVSDEIYNYVDFERKKFVKRVASVDIGDFDWSYTGIGPRFYVGNMPQNIKTDRTDAAKDYVVNAITPSYTATSRNKVTDADKMFSIFWSAPDNYNSMSVKDTTYTDAASFKSAMQGVQLIYELATPEEIDISAYLPDDVYVKADGSVIYRSDSGLAVPYRMQTGIMSRLWETAMDKGVPSPVPSGDGIEIIHSLPSSPVADKIYYYPDSDVGASLFAFTDNRWRYVTMGIYGQNYFYNAAYIKQNAVLIGDTPQEAVRLINRALSIGDRVFAEACTIAGLNQPNANNRFNIRINCEYATHINFYVGCAGEGGNYDYMEIYIDDEKVSDVKPDTSRKEIPQKVTVYLSSGGYHTIGFRYKSDGSSFYEEDSGFVYGIEFVG